MTTAATLMQQDALAGVVHDLRLPLSHIKGFVTALRRTDVEWDEETRCEFLAEIDREADRLAQLVEFLLDAGRRDRRSSFMPDLEFTDPASVVDGAIDRLRGSLAQHALLRDVPMNLVAVRMNARQMERVLANLIENATKYAPVGTAIGVSARITRDCELEYMVQDHGPGVPERDRQRIFGPFFRTQSANASDVPGYGLGLAISQSIVLAHGGRIEVVRTPGGGASFSVFLPLDASQAQRNDTANHSHRGRRGADAQTAQGQPQR